MSDCTAAAALPIESYANTLLGVVVNEGPTLTVNAAAVSTASHFFFFFMPLMSSFLIYEI
jgi:hypothetical protein